MKLFIVHCGFYDMTVNKGLFEGHTNFLIAAKNFAKAKSQAKSLPEFRRLKMHIDGIQEVVAVEGHTLELKYNPKLEGKTLVRRQKYGSIKNTLLEL